MRLLYRTLTRPRHLAERIKVVFPALTHGQSQEWAAQLVGYRSWHELSQSIGPDVQETPDFVFRLDANHGFLDTPESRLFFQRQREQERRLAQLMGRPVPGMSSLFFHVNPNYPDVRFRKLGQVKKGQPFFQGLAHDLYAAEGGKSGGGGGRCQDIGDFGGGLCIWAGLPPDVASPVFHENLLSAIRKSRKPFARYDEVARDTLCNPRPFSVSHLDYDTADEAGSAQWRASQGRRLRFFLLDKGAPRGFCVLTTRASAAAKADESGMQLTIEIEEGWSALDGDEVDDAWANSIASEVSAVVERILWMRVAAPDGADTNVNVEVLTESESQFTWQLAHDLVEYLPDAVGIEGLAEEALKDVNWYAEICP